MPPPVHVLEKTFIPGFLPGEKPQLVNAKQARRIVIMRKKKCKRLLELREQGVDFNPIAVLRQRGSVRMKPKNMARVKHALGRKRIGGFFMSKRREELIARRQ